MVDIRSTAAEIRRGKKRRKKERNYRAKIYMVSLLHRATINQFWVMREMKCWRYILLKHLPVLLAVRPGLCHPVTTRNVGECPT